MNNMIYVPVCHGCWSFDAFPVAHFHNELPPSRIANYASIN